jgi:hypothetical protein
MGALIYSILSQKKKPQMSIVYPIDVCEEVLRALKGKFVTFKHLKQFGSETK